ncbi:phage adaptor protein [Enterobacter hormaechei]|uniref:phage adaptor protein n=1 Tax=Enterobacter hormaechei TaxID=158836 RepID=UPI003B213F45
MIMGYISDTPELVKDSDSCTILTIAPDLLLYMSLKHAALFVQDDEGAQKWGMMAEAALTCSPLINTPRC